MVRSRMNSNYIDNIIKDPKDKLIFMSFSQKTVLSGKDHYNLGA